MSGVTTSKFVFLQKLKDITTFVFDVDGVLTDGSILVSETGEALRQFNIKDGYALQLAVKKGYNVCIISGGKGKAMERRFESLGITDVYLGAGDKTLLFHEYLAARSVSQAQVLYMGDDIPDLAVMKLAGIAACPADAVPEIKAVSMYISPFTGGRTAVRDIIEKVLRVQGQWFDRQPDAADSGK
ncbi:3-deoxy-D-manno-octulosonate 8-phosphate phosphatase [Pedobacter yulinensis]|uniref:3-deoxy-D-manno-octulosonate 8-phosphate phosphatase n=1 Tax=Pedobacter yulinensis TaxID=2126353 RepID=A0A2T3HH46_9SPHI|nr:HAD-IIIA family hydrolase [Pedobacter yulinensis]PST81768.1 3-deoxy-D-manno-octulosonate 8-phosphate phosphatase [Pedobacter yulinensis]